jgi:lysophospholipase-3
LDAKLNKPSTVHYLCDKKTKNFFNLWLNLELLAPIEIDCWADNIRLVYNATTRQTNNSPGVETRIPGWGAPETTEWIDPSHISQGSYFNEISNALVKHGWVRNKSIRGAPYDFRKAPDENRQWFFDLKELVEETYRINGNVPVTFVCHSLGVLMSTAFLQKQTDSWKEKYIARMITLAGAWGGSKKSVKIYAIGDNLGEFVLDSRAIRKAQISYPSLAWLLPSPLFFKPDDVLVRTKSRNYTMSQMEDFLRWVFRNCRYD